MEIKIKGQNIQDWLEWVTKELEPPLNVDKQTKYVLEAFKECLENWNHKGLIDKFFILDVINLVNIHKMKNKTLWNLLELQRKY